VKLRKKIAGAAEYVKNNPDISYMMEILLDSGKRLNHK